MKAKVNLVEDKLKRKFMNPKGKKLKKPNHFHSFSMLAFLLSNLLNLPPSNLKPLARRLMEDSVTSAEERITWRLNVLTGRKYLSKLNEEEMAGTRSTW